MPFSPSDLYSAFDTPSDPVVAFLTWLAETAALPRNLHIADVGAGPGRLVRPLAEHGWTVTAYEPNPEYLVAAQRIAAEGRGAVAVKPGGFEDITEDTTFHLVVGINSSFAHLLTRRERAVGLSAAMRSLRPGGLLVLDVPNMPWILDHYRRPEAQERPYGGGSIRLEREHKIDRQERTFTTLDRYTVTGLNVVPQSSTQVHVYAIVTAEELWAEVAAAGFIAIRDYASFESRTPRDTPGRRLLIVAQRPMILRPPT